MRAPTHQNSKTRYFTHLLNHFALKLWSFRFEVFWTCVFKSRAPVFWSASFFIFVVSNRGSYPLKGTVFMELSFEQVKNIIKHSVSDQRKLSFVELSIGKWKRHQNQSFFRKRRILRIKIKTLFLGLVPCSSELNLHSFMKFDKEST